MEGINFEARGERGRDEGRKWERSMEGVGDWRGGKGGGGKVGRTWKTGRKERERRGKKEE